ncbi:hydrogen gas-evolving membrane-bound hydrogenase subunit E [Haloferula sp.]|uniref:hydrogen gas-evolving membrane-bound hydrogenase subunit E n=1 Tax=Haloferula sp. TaxID=2497595 RepID=UPI003C749D46
MDPVFLFLGAPLVPALLVLLGRGLVSRHATVTGWLCAGWLALCAGLLLQAVPGEVDHQWKVDWLPQLGVELSLRMDSFGAWFGVLILGLGACIMLYAACYFAGKPRLPYLLICLGLFTTAMLGVIWSDNIFLLFLFWEATSLLSFLLVGFHDEKEETREKASQALLVTLGGGAAMLAGLILMQLHFDTASISEMLSAAGTEQVTTLSGWAVVLVILGAITKSAQWPFHFWLPNAMAGPTPVSAFLHSATMVKAGVFLLATLAPLLSAHPVWTPLLGFSGILTIMTAFLRAAREDDLKAILASTTLAALGFLTLLAAIGTPAALLGFVILMTAHALYKAPLFLAVGNLEKCFGTRQISKLQGTARLVPATGAGLAISAFSLIGLAPLPGFLGKEYLLKATWAYSPLMAVAVALAAAGVIGLGLKIVIPLLSGKSNLTPRVNLPLGMNVAVIAPALGALMLMLTLPQSNHAFLGAAASSLGAPPEAAYKLWHGWTPALGLGMGALVFSLLIWRVMSRPRLAPLPATFAPLFDNLFDFFIALIRGCANGVARMLEAGKPGTQLAWMLVLIGLVTGSALKIHQWPDGNLLSGEGSASMLLLMPVIALAAITAALAKRTITLLVALGFVGLSVAVFFLWFSAPDLALTQLLAETLLLFLLGGVLMKANQNRKASGFSPGRAIFALAGGLLMMVLVLKSIALEWDHPISDFHLTQSKPAAFGANVVNVILVDFRALDTFGEIIVLAIAAIGATASLGAARKRAPLPGNSSSSWLRTGAGLVMMILVPLSLWTFWRGHNAPGGGFIGALVGASAVGMGLLTGRRFFGPVWMRRNSMRLMVSGLSIALISALLPLLVGRPFFSGLWWHSGDLHLGTPLLFDLGVFLSVLGFALSYLRHFSPNRT